MNSSPENLKPSYSVLYGEPSTAVNNFYSSVYRNPGAFLLAINSLAGESSTDTIPSPAEAVSKINNFMAEDHDLNIRYDDITEGILREDTDHHTKINKLQGSSPENREVYRNAVRYNRIAHFIKRVVGWDESQKNLHQVA